MTKEQGERKRVQMFSNILSILEYWSHLNCLFWGLLPVLKIGYNSFHILIQLTYFNFMTWILFWSFATLYTYLSNLHILISWLELHFDNYTSKGIILNRSRMRNLRLQVRAEARRCRSPRTRCTPAPTTSSSSPSSRGSPSLGTITLG